MSGWEGSREVALMVGHAAQYRLPVGIGSTHNGRMRIRPTLLDMKLLR